MRNADGTFAKGNPGGPGRPRRQVEIEYLAHLTDAVTLDDWSEIARRAVEDAKSGDVKAREWLSRYLVSDSTLECLRRDSVKPDGTEYTLIEQLERQAGC